MFPVGTKVICMDTSGWDKEYLSVGKQYEVVALALSQLNHNVGGDSITVKTDKGVYGTFFSFRFKLAKQQTFNVSTATDQELAGEFRRRTDARNEVAIALGDRGYSLYNERGKIDSWTLGSVFKIKKSQVTEL